MTKHPHPGSSFHESRGSGLAKKFQQYNETFGATPAEGATVDRVEDTASATATTQRSDTDESLPSSLAPQRRTPKAPFEPESRFFTPLVKWIGGGVFVVLFALSSAAIVLYSDVQRHENSIGTISESLHAVSASLQKTNVDVGRIEGQLESLEQSWSKLDTTPEQLVALQTSLLHAQKAVDQNGDDIRGLRDRLATIHTNLEKLIAAVETPKRSDKQRREQGG